MLAYTSQSIYIIKLRIFLFTPVIDERNGEQQCSCRYNMLRLHERKQAKHLYLAEAYGKNQYCRDNAYEDEDLSA